MYQDLSSRDYLRYRYRPRRYRVIRATASAGWKLGRWTIRRGYTYRRKMLPVYTSAALFAMATGLNSVPDGWRTALALSALSGVGVWWRLRHSKASAKVRRRNRIYAWLVHIGASVWTTVAAAVGPWHPPTPGFLLALGLPAAVAWWWHHRIRVEAETITKEIGDHPADVWEATIGADDGGLPHSALTGVEASEDGNGWSGNLVLPSNGKLTTGSAIAAVPNIASAFDLPLPSVVVEPPPGGSMRRAKLAVYYTNPLEKVRHWPGPRLRPDGVAPVGPFADGDEALYRFWRPGSGAVHSLVAGATDSGKSRFVDMLLCEERASPLISSWVIDPQRGQSLPDWQDSVDYFADSAQEGVRLLREAVAKLFDRNETLARMEWVDGKGRKRRGKAFFDPTPEMPLMSITIEEAHRVLSDPEGLAACEAIGNMGRKCGVKLRLVVQIPLLDQLGGSTALRDAVASGNVIVFRTANRLSGQVAFNGNLPGADPALLPREWPDGSSTGGLGYLLGGTSRSSTFRSLLVEDAYHWATVGETTPIEGGLLLPAYSTWRIRRDNPDAPEPEMTEMPAEVAPAAQSKKDAILAYLTAKGVAHTGVIAEAVDASRSTVSTTLARLEEAGLVRKVQHGVWGIVQEEEAVEAEAVAV